MAVKVQLRRGTASEWQSANPTLSQGELGVETDTTKFKVGNGSTAWNSLGYASVSNRGTYSGATQYYVNDIVQYSGGSYICILASLNNLPTNTTYWSVLAAAGSVQTNQANTFTAAQTFGSGYLKLSGSTSGTATLNAPSVASTNVYVLPSDASTLGYVNAPPNSQSASYTTVLSDSGKTLVHPAADTTARTFTIDDTLAYDTGTVITFINQTSQTLTVTCTTANNLYLAGTGTQGARALAQYGLATAVKVAANYWLITGNGLT
jgi:hypothetical protein